MLFTVRTAWQHFATLALFTVAAVVSHALGNEMLAYTFAGFVGGAATISRPPLLADERKAPEVKP